MKIYEDAARATLQIECGSFRGSGFFINSLELIITNHHVIEKYKPGVFNIFGKTESGQQSELELIANSSKKDEDFAILRAKKNFGQNSHFLEPKILNSYERGKAVIFSGFPHGIPHLLVQNAVIAGNITDNTFYIDGSVNGGNSGGPIIDLTDGKVIGIVTQRRYLNIQEFEDLQKEFEQIQNYFQKISGQGKVNIMGIDFMTFAEMQAKAILLIKKLIELNTNVGIGIGFSIRFAVEELQRRKII